MSMRSDAAALSGERKRAPQPARIGQVGAVKEERIGMTRTISGEQSRIVKHGRLRVYIPAALAIVALLLGIVPQSANAQTAQRCFTETNFCISGRIREFWEQNG